MGTMKRVVGEHSNYSRARIDGSVRNGSIAIANGKVASLTEQALGQKEGFALLLLFTELAEEVDAAPEGNRRWRKAGTGASSLLTRMEFPILCLGNLNIKTADFCGIRYDRTSKQRLQNCNSPAYSLQIREIRGETGLLRTAPRTKQS